MRFRQPVHFLQSRYSTQSIWIFIGVISWTVPLGIYNWFGPLYFSDGRILVASTLMGYVVCGLLLLV
ncbi:hypothetical protein [Larkinella humicola]|uniref:Uncharacterized protein n=1 Tax=Larkinella humicola TaxID=2607654 RepID=A0A5N1JIT7_9BACT|nr:hypothetical protein [Larkinella humicola]KAA9356355.1 hypothetical protein F0P93_00965 [Larkinella humicola]